MDDTHPKYARRDPATVGKVSVDPAVLAGKPRIAGTRISVELILQEMSAGSSVDDLLKAYPQLRRQDVQAALEHALRAIRHEEVRVLPEAAG